MRAIRCYFGTANAAAGTCIIALALSGCAGQRTAPIVPATINAQSEAVSLLSGACSWKIVKSPNPSQQGQRLDSVSATSATDAWSVGRSGSPDSVTLAEHWNGTAWSVAVTKNPSTSFNELFSTSAITANDVWAAGGYYAAGGYEQPLFEHWNGTAWSLVTSPAVGGSSGSYIAGIVAIAANNVWAVGVNGFSKSGATTLVEHWNGTKWSVVTSPNPGSLYNILTSVAAVSANSIWAGGYAETSSEYTTLAEHWNGKIWSVVPTVNEPSPIFNAMAAASTGQVFALGDYYDSSVSTHQTLGEKLSGTQFNLQKTPNVGTLTAIYGASAASSTAVMAVGVAGNSAGSDQSYSMYWNGAKWSTVATKNSSLNDQLAGASKIPGTSEFWAVGNTFNSNFSPNLTLIEEATCI